MIEVIRDPGAMQAWVRQARKQGQRIAFVPTMGYLHEGHVALLRAGRARGELLVLSIFVNPLQFGKTEDLSRYPQDEQGDLRKAEAAGCDVAFCPSAQSMYPEGMDALQCRVSVGSISEILCGALRPGHFTGVATVVLKLLHLVQPHVMLLGEKDYQQLLVIRRMASDLNLDVEVCSHPLVREADGLAMSSRNSYLSPTQRQQALAISRGLLDAQECFTKGERRAGVLLSRAEAEFAKEAALRPQYLELRDGKTLDLIEPGWEIAQGQVAVMLFAGYVGTTRLIDNVILGRL